MAYFFRTGTIEKSRNVPILLRIEAVLAAVCSPGLTMASCQCPPSCSPLPLHNRAENRVEKHMGDSREVTYQLPS